MPESKIEAISKLIPLATQYAEFALIFGSTARDQLRDQLMDESDLDAAFFLKPEFALHDQFTLKKHLQDSFERDLDLIILNHADIIITQQVLANGELIYEANPHFFLQFKGQKLSQYLDFKMSRKVIEDNLLTKGWPIWKKTT